MIAPPYHVIRAAVTAARPDLCAKSNRGAVVYDPRSGAIMGAGFNSQPEPFVCARTEACRTACRELCVHAEVRAIRDALTIIGANGVRLDLGGLELVHAKVVDGQLVAGGGPSCLGCSPAVLDSGLAAVWLYEERQPDGPSGYRCRACGARMSSYHQYEEYQHSKCGGLVLREPEIAWRRYTAREFHEVTAAHHGIRLETAR